MSNNESKLIIAFTGNPVDAEMVCNMLIAEGLQATMNNQILGSLVPWQVSAGGFEPVDVVVFEEDVEKAQDLIKAFVNEE